MSDTLDTIDAALEEVEEQLLSELSRFRIMTPEADYCTLDQETKSTLRDAVNELDHNLERSGDDRQLELRTERHEVLAARIVTLKQILNREIPGDCLHEANEEVKNSRDRLENRVLARRKKLEPTVTIGQRREQTEALKGLFDRAVSERVRNRNRFLVTRTEEKDLEDVEEFVDGGIYSASRELTMLANLIRQHANKPRLHRRGRAVFEARDLRSSLSPVNKVKPIPEPEPATEETAKEQEEEKYHIARTPEEIRRKLEERKYKSSGRASFVAKDIEPAHPREYYGRKREKDDNDD